jgi:DNA primase
LRSEKDADRIAALNLCATTVAAGKWTEDCIKALAGRDIIILEDNDDAGRKKALEAATALHGVANNIRIVSLPGLPDKGDVSDRIRTTPRNLLTCATCRCGSQIKFLIET